MGIFGRLFGKKKKEQPKASTVNVEKESSFPEIKTESKKKSLTIESIKEKVFPIVKVSTTAADGLPDASKPIKIDVSQVGLSVFAMQDAPQYYVALRKKHLGDMNEEDALKIAFKNLTTRYSNMKIGFLEIENRDIGKVGVIQNAGDMAASVFFMSSIWDNIYEAMGTKKLHFIIPSQNNFLFCPADNKKGTQFLSEIAKEYHESSEKPLVDDVFFFNEDKSMGKINL